MAKDTQGRETNPSGAGGSVATSGGARKKPERRIYEHKMTERDRFALQSVLKAKGALTAMAVAIQEGKGCNADLVQSCLDLQSAAAKALFAE